MLSKNKLQNWLILFITLVTILMYSNCSLFSKIGASQPTENSKKEEEKPTKYGEPKVLGKIEEPFVKESSGIVASRRNKDVFWTHNDSGGDVFIYAFNRKGKKLGVWKVAGAKNTDWEDIAAYKDTKTGECYLLLGDIGNNNKVPRKPFVYRIVEPKITDSSSKSTKQKPLTTEAASILRLTYPDTFYDAETMMVHPESGEIYILTKNLIGSSEVYKAEPSYNAKKAVTLKKVANISVPALPNGFLTGGDISPNGKRVVVCDYFGAYELVLPKDAKNFDEIWEQSPTKIDLGERKQGEAICYRLDGKAVLATSEQRDSPLIEVENE